MLIAQQQQQHQHQSLQVFLFLTSLVLQVVVVQARIDEELQGGGEQQPIWQIVGGVIIFVIFIGMISITIAYFVCVKKNKNNDNDNPQSQFINGNGNGDSENLNNNEDTKRTSTISQNSSNVSSEDEKKKKRTKKNASGTTAGSMHIPEPVHGTIIVVAKCPIPGKSKTRLIPLLGEIGSAQLAKSMLSDVLKTIDGCLDLDSVRKILLYAPGDAKGYEMMKRIFDELDLITDNSNNTWHLLPMLMPSALASSSPSSSHNDDIDDDLKSHDLGAKLEDALIQVRMLSQQEQQRSQSRNNNDNGVVFLGMDAPILPLNDIVEGLRKASSSLKADQDQQLNITAATLCPSYDGGYVMVCIPPNAIPSKTFLSTQHMYWSHSLTAISQMKCLTDQNIKVCVGQIMYDIDEPSDVHQLCHYLQKNIENETAETTSSTATNKICNDDNDNKKNLDYQSGWSSSNNDTTSTSNSPDGNNNSTMTATTLTVTSRHPTCYFTRQTLIKAGLFD
mmetsp:Transcript_5421/g.6248  ORF Transcript_5421/g.6248 Transcript_5421/m.6248 type:complete len:505 (+) Transcript_5421:77-1591(+)